MRRLPPNFQARLLHDILRILPIAENPLGNLHGSVQMPSNKLPVCPHIPLSRTTEQLVVGQKISQKNLFFPTSYNF